MRERDDGEARGRVETWGRASDNGQVYQAGADQYVTHIHIAEDRSRTAHEARQRADVVVQVLTRAIGEWAARCRELEEKAGRAKAEGRAEAGAEFAEKLKDAELRVMRARSTMRQAEEERARAEALLAQAQEELARRRREVERDAEQEREAAPLPAHPGLSQERQDTEQFSELMERAEAELGAVREELRQLGEEIDGDTAQVVEGEWASRPTADEQPAPEAAVGLPGSKPVQGGLVARALLAERPLWPGPPRRLRIGSVFVVCMLPPWIPMIAVTANRAAYATDTSPSRLAAFTAFTVILGVVVCMLAAVCVAFMAIGLLSRSSEQKAGDACVRCMLVAAPLLLVAAFFTPLDWPGPLGAWGKALLSAAGLG